MNVPLADKIRPDPPLDRLTAEGLRNAIRLFVGACWRSGYDRHYTEICGCAVRHRKVRDPYGRLVGRLECSHSFGWAGETQESLFQGLVQRLDMSPYDDRRILEY